MKTKPLILSTYLRNNYRSDQWSSGRLLNDNIYQINIYYIKEKYNSVNIRISKNMLQYEYISSITNMSTFYYVQ